MIKYPNLLIRLTVMVSFFAIVLSSDALAEMKNEMTTENLYEGVLVVQMQMRGIVVNDKEKMAAANNSIRFLEGYAAAWTIDDPDFAKKLIEQVAAHLGKHPEKRKAKLPIVMREVLESMDRSK